MALLFDCFELILNDVSLVIFCKDGVQMRIAAYCRVSTDEEKQLDSLQHQKDFFEDFAKKNDLQLVRIYADEGISGKSIKNRDEFIRLMSDAEKHKFDMVVVKDISRFARNAVDFLTYIRKLKAIGIPCNFVNANLSTSDSELVLGMLSLVAQEESSNLSKRVKFGKNINAKKGRVPPRIYGYNRIDNFTLEINQDEADIVKLIYSLYIDKGLGSRSIALYLNDKEIQTKYGKKWYTKAIRRILTNSIYYGLYENHKYEIKDYIEGTRGYTSQDEHYFHNRPEWAIITKERFEEANKIITSRRNIYKNQTTHLTGRYSSKYPLSTIIKCEHCGKTFCRKSYENLHYKRVFWKCSTNDQLTSKVCDNNITLDEDELMYDLSDMLRNRMSNIDAFKEELRRIAIDIYQSSYNNYDLTNLHKQLEKLFSKKQKYQDMFTNDIIGMNELKNKTKTIMDEINRINNILDETETQLTDEELDDHVSMFIGYIQDFLDNKNTDNMAMKKIFNSITVNKNGNIKIEFNI